MDVISLLFLIVFFWLVFAGINWLVLYLMAKSRAQILSAEDFAKSLTSENGQLIDLRESAPYKRGHILGARNIPAMNFGQGKSGLRLDQDVFLYDESVRGAVRVAGRLKKEGFKRDHVYILRGGYGQFKGRRTK